MTDTTHAHGFAAPTGDEAPYLDTQTLAGGDGYFHTENAPTHRTDGNAEGQSPETPLVASSRGGESPAAAQQQAHATTTATTSDQYETWTNSALSDELDRRGIEAPPRANKAQLLAALRGE